MSYVVTLSMSTLCGCHGNTVVGSSESVEVCGGDESSGEWNLSHTLQFPGRLAHDGMHISSLSH